MDNLKCCFFCLKSLPGDKPISVERKSVCQFFEMVQRHVCGDSLLTTKQTKGAKQVKSLLNDGDILSCLECLSVLKTFNGLYDQLKTIELKTNMVLGKIGNIMGNANNTTMARKMRPDNDYHQTFLHQRKKNYDKHKETVDNFNRARQDLQLKCSIQLTRRVPFVAVKRCNQEKSDKVITPFSTDNDIHLDATIKQEFFDDVKPNLCSTTITPLNHETVNILLAMTSLKIVLQLSLITIGGFRSLHESNQKRLTFYQNGVRNILLVFASLKIVFELGLTYENQKFSPAEAVEIPIDTNCVHYQYQSISKTGRECDNTSQSAKVAKVTKDVLKCHRCEQAFNNFSSLKYHWIHCNLQNEKTSSIPATSDELVTMTIEKDPCADNKTMKNVLRKKIFACAKCPKIVKNSENLKRHQLTHSDPSTWPHPCSVCGKRFIKRENMQIHTLKHHPNDPTTKPIRLRRELQLRCSQRKVHVTQPKPRYQKKERRRRQLKKYICPECGRNCKNKTVYNYHVMTHSSPETWEHRCSYCDKRFILKYQLNYHLRTHTKEKPFACLECGEKFAHTSLRLRHMLIWHGPTS